jgi:nitroimidazol reductase NimA-like FMN-containing flavoprotein (pyridoxamine 5'-phosphate oxidase superfamily)
MPAGERLPSAPVPSAPVSPVPVSPAPALSATERTRHHRLREQGRTDGAELDAVLRAGFIAHLGVLSGGVPMVVPTCYGYDGQQLYLHGSVASQSLDSGESAVCVTVTLVDGLVLARSVFEHAVNYRSAMIYGIARAVTEAEAKLAGLRCLAEHLAPGQWDYARQPSRKELAATRLLVLALDEASVKIRSGPPDDADSPDAALGLWAGELPLRACWQRPVADPALDGRVPVPEHIRAMVGLAAHPLPGERP